MIIFTDSAADLPPEEIKEFGVRVVPLQIQFPEGGVSSDEIGPDEFYRRMAAMWPDIPTTSQPSAGVFSTLYSKQTDMGEEILSIHISSGLSGTLESARVGASQVNGANVKLVDTKTLSGGQRFQVLAAALGSRAGWSSPDILERLNEIRNSTEVIFTLETLAYLARGGRIGRVQALAGSLLKIKPIIKVEKADGKYSSAGKERTLQRAIDKIADHLQHVYGSEAPVWTSVMHGQFAEHAKQLAGLLSIKLNVVRSEILRISPVLGVHTGPGVVGAAVVPMSLMEGLQ